MNKNIRTKKINKIIKEAQIKNLRDQAKELADSNTNDNLGEGDKFQIALFDLIKFDGFDF